MILFPWEMLSLPTRSFSESLGFTSTYLEPVLPFQIRKIKIVTQRKRKIKKKNERSKYGTVCPGSSDPPEKNI